MKVPWISICNLRLVAFSLTLLPLVQGCGRFMDPIAPEMVAPKEVDALEVTAKEEGIMFSWTTPDKDRRGKELKFIDGYSVERKELVERGDETDPDVEFFQLAFIPDTSIKVREELREKARAEGKIGRRIQAPGELKQFSFLDPTPQKGRKYIYQIVPQNQGDVEGVVKRSIKVIFNGAESDISNFDDEAISVEDATATATANTGTERQ